MIERKPTRLTKDFDGHGLWEKASGLTIFGGLSLIVAGLGILPALLIIGFWVFGIGMAIFVIGGLFVHGDLFGWVIGAFLLVATVSGLVTYLLDIQ